MTIPTPNPHLKFVKDESVSDKFQNVLVAETGDPGLRWFIVEYTGTAETTSLILAHQHDGVGTHVIHREVHHNVQDALDQASAVQHFFSDHFEEYVAGGKFEDALALSQGA